VVEGSFLLRHRAGRQISAGFDQPEMDQASGGCLGSGRPRQYWLGARTEGYRRCAPFSGSDRSEPPRTSRRLPWSQSPADRGSL